MRRRDKRNKYLLGIIMLGILGISYCLIRYAFYGQHGMKQWPSLLAAASVAIIIVATIIGNKVMPVVTVAGYLFGYMIAMIFHSGGVDQGGGRTDNAWIIWGVIYVFTLLIGSITAFLSERTKTRQINHLNKGDQ